VQHAAQIELLRCVAFRSATYDNAIVRSDNSQITVSRPIAYN